MFKASTEKKILEYEDIYYVLYAENIYYKKDE